MAAQTGFQYNYKPIDYKTAQGQALQQLDPLYQQSLKSLYANQTQQQNLTGQQAASRGLGHSGLAQDALNKIAIATQGNVSNLNAQRMTQANTMATDLVNQDKQYDLQRRGQLYSEYAGNRDYNYNVGRDKVADSQWQKTYNRGVYESDRSFKYQQGRDKRQDFVTDREWNNMSPAQKQQMALEYSYSKKLKGSSGGGGGGGGRGRRGGTRGGSPYGGVTANGAQDFKDMPQWQFEQYLQSIQQRHNHDATVTMIPNSKGVSAYDQKMKRMYELEQRRAKIGY